MNSNESVLRITFQVHIVGLKRYFNERWGYDLKILYKKDQMSRHIDGGLWTTLDNHVRHSQAQEKGKKLHNIFSEGDVRTLLKAPKLHGRTSLSL